MDDCNLDKLAIKPGKLTPKFHRDTTEYTVTLGSDVEKLTFDCLTSDTGACYCISGSGGSRTVPLKEGEVTDIKIEVTAEDGTIKNYFVHAKRLSAKDASLSDIKLNIGQLSPEFAANIIEYSCIVPCDTNAVTISVTTPDSKCKALIDGNPPGSPSSLNTGDTQVDIAVTSPDGSNTQTYSIVISRKQIPRYIKPRDPSLAMELECPVSLSVLYRPITIKHGEVKNTYTGPIIEEFVKTCKVDPLNELPLGSDWRTVDHEMEKRLTKAACFIPRVDGSSSETVPLGELGGQLKSCSVAPKVTVKDKTYSTNVPFKHTVKEHSWEKKLQQSVVESSAPQLCTSAEENIKKYLDSIPKPGYAVRFASGESPLDYLQNAACCYAAAIRQKPKDASLHINLAYVLEERYYTIDLLGIKSEKDNSEAAGINTEAKESSKEEECAAICMLRGVPAGSPLSLQLMAIDQEYHHLLESGQSGKADHVQALFQWKAKQATKGGAVAQRAADDESPLGQAYLKYMDTLCLDESKALHSFHVGRMLVIQGQYEDAVQRLEVALGWNAQHQMSRFYLGLALSLQEGGPGSRAQEAISYLLEAMEALMAKNSEEALSADETSWRPAGLHVDNLLKNNNVYLLRGIIQLGKLLQTQPDIKDCMNAADVFHNGALLAAQILTSIARGDTYQLVEWMLFEAHSQLLDILLKSQKDDHLIAQRCHRLSALIRRATIPQNEELLALQLKTLEKLVLIRPCDSLALYKLGAAQLAQYEDNPEAKTAEQMLKDAVSSFRASISLEGKTAAGEAADLVTGQKWWQEKQKAEAAKREVEAKKAAAAAPAGPAAGPAKGRGAPAARGGAGRGGAARGGATVRGAARGTVPAATQARTAAPKAGAASKAMTPSKPGAKTAPAKPGGSPVKAVGTASKAAGTSPASSKAPARPGSKTGTRPGSAKNGSAKPGARPASGNKDKKTEETTGQTEAAQNEAKSAGKAPAPMNRKTYHARLGLARALAKNTEDLSECQKYYNEVITMAPEVHDAYIEVAELLVKKDPMGAVDIYCKFPVSENPTFDDAYIFGEIVRLLMKAEEYDDPRLQSNMIALGKVMGIACLEKHVAILDSKFKTNLLKEVYAGVNGKSVDDPDMQAFFKFKCWI